MNERDKELYQQATGKAWAYDFDIDTAEKFADLIRADATEAANARANISWVLMCKKVVEAEREACANIARDIGNATEPDDWALDKCDEIETAIRAMGNT
jgi:hypothetical protein